MQSSSLYLPGFSLRIVAAVSFAMLHLSRDPTSVPTPWRVVAGYRRGLARIVNEHRRLARFSVCSGLARPAFPEMGRLVTLTLRIWAAAILLSGCNTPVGTPSSWQGTYLGKAIVTNPDGDGPQVLRYAPPIWGGGGGGA